MAKNVAEGLWEMLASAGVRRCYGIVGDAHDRVVAGGELARGHDRRPQHSGPVRACDAEPAVTQSCGALRPYQHGHVAPGIHQARRDKSADRSRSDDQEPHGSPC
jgi:hypothetical protein